MSIPVYRPIVHIQELGEQARLPSGGIVDIGGVSGPYFTVNGKPVIMADGTASDGTGTVISVDSNNVVGFEWRQQTPAQLWHIPHNRNSNRVQITIWDEADELLLADIVKIVDLNVVNVAFNTAVSGRAILMIF